MSSDVWVPFIRREPTLRKLTVEAVTLALDGFEMEPRQGVEWLARAMQGALLFILPGMRSLDPLAVSTDIEILVAPSAWESRDAYRELTDRAESFWLAITKHGELLRSTVLGPHEYGALERQLEELVSEFREWSTAEPTPPPPRWRDSRARAKRIERAKVLSPVYELAFEVVPAVNSWPESNGGPWPDFYQRIVGLAFNEHKTPDLHGILKEARRIDRSQRVKFNPGIIPEFPL